MRGEREPFIRWDDWVEPPADTPAWKKLANLMSGLSEECYCAGWMHGCEYDFWAMLVGDADRSYGQDEVTADELAVLRRLSAECGGWVYWSEEQEQHSREDGSTYMLDKGETFVPMEQWLAMYARVLIPARETPTPESK